MQHRRAYVHQPKGEEEQQDQRVVPEQEESQRHVSKLPRDKLVRGFSMAEKHMVLESVRQRIKAAQDRAKARQVIHGQAQGGYTSTKWTAKGKPIRRHVPGYEEIRREQYRKAVEEEVRERATRDARAAAAKNRPVSRRETPESRKVDQPRNLPRHPSVFEIWAERRDQFLREHPP